MYNKYATGGLAEQKAKRPNPYDGNTKEADSTEKELKSYAMADGGMAGKKKGAIMAIIAKLGKKPSELSDKLESESSGEEEGGGGDMMHEAKLSAASEVMDALKSGDREAFAAGLENFLKCCGEMED